MYLFFLHVHNHFVMIYRTTAYNSKTNHHYANNPKNARRKGNTHTHTKNWLQIIMQWHSTQLA